MSKILLFVMSLILTACATCPKNPNGNPGGGGINCGAASVNNIVPSNLLALMKSIKVEELKNINAARIINNSSKTLTVVVQNTSVNMISLDTKRTGYTLNSIIPRTSKVLYLDKNRKLDYLHKNDIEVISVVINE